MQLWRLRVIIGLSFIAVIALNGVLAHLMAGAGLNGFVFIISQLAFVVPMAAFIGGFWADAEHMVETND